MGLTITEKIIADHTGRVEVEPGQILDVPVDLLFIHDNNGPIAIEQFARLAGVGVWDPKKVLFFLDHHCPATTLRAAGHQRDIRRFARQHGITVIDMGRGISHAVLAEDGRARPGRIILGTDSHTVGLGSFGCLATGIGSTEAAAVMATGRIWLRVPETVKVVLTGDLLAAGANIGYGSSREQAPTALKHAGLRAVVAVSFARIFYRNCYNIGLPALVCPTFVEEAADGDTVRIDLSAGLIQNTSNGRTYTFVKPPDFLLEYIRAGGLIPYLQRKSAR